MHTNVNVVIPVYNPDEKLEKIIEMLSRQTNPVKKVILMNTLTGDSSKDEAISKKISSVCKQCHVNMDEAPTESYDGMSVEKWDICSQDFDHGKTRNEGVSHVSDDCEIVVLMTHDAIPANDRLVEELIKPFQDEKVAASYARQIATDKSSLAEVFTRGFNYPAEDRIKMASDIDKIGIKAFFCSNVCAAYRLSVFRSLGGFINRAIFNEDMVYAHKVLVNGYYIAYASKAEVIHTHDYTGMQQYKRNFDLAVSQKMNPEAFDGISSESEGVKYVKAAFAFFVKNKRPFLIIPFGINCVYKYLGYRKGKNYTNLSMNQILKCTMNPSFWKKTE